MEVVYDISALRRDPNHLQSRTGVARVVENVAAGLRASGECELQFCAANSFLHLKRAADYLRGRPDFGGVPFVEPEGERVRGIATGMAERIAGMNRAGRVPLPSRVARRLMSYGLRFMEEKYHRYDAARFPREGVFHSPFYALPGRSKLPAKLKRFLTVYDLIPILAPQFFNHERGHFLHDILRSLRPDDWVICISEATRGELCEYLGLDPSRVFVAHPAASPELFYRLEDEAELSRVRAKYGIPDAPYVLSLNTLEPRKNIEHSIRCFARAAREAKLGDLHFVLVGARGWDDRRIFDAVSEHPELKGRIILTGYVEDEDLAAVYSGALAFVYMSLYEGFGLPPLEAMQCGVPVVTSDASSLPEVVGDAGIVLDPKDADGLCQSIVELYGKASLRESLSEKSLRRAQSFGWEKSTRATLDAYKVALGS